jgi:hypothetical protein
MQALGQALFFFDTSMGQAGRKRGLVYDLQVLEALSSAAYREGWRVAHWR